MDYKLQLVLIPVSDVDRAKKFYADQAGCGVAIGQVRHMESGTWADGPHPDRASYQSFADFADPDGNIRVLQEVDHDKS
jgi:hypothetical protein